MQAKDFVNDGLAPKTLRLTWEPSLIRPSECPGTRRPRKINSEGRSHGFLADGATVVYSISSRSVVITDQWEYIHVQGPEPRGLRHLETSFHDDK